MKKETLYMGKLNVCVLGGKKCQFFGKCGGLCFLVALFEIRLFALLPTIYAARVKGEHCKN